MSIDLKKALLAGIFTALIVGISTVHAGGKAEGIIKNLEPSVDAVESVVVAIKSSPFTEVKTDTGWVVGEVDEAATEAACIAVQIAKNLAASKVKEGDGTVVEVTPADEVSLFLTLGGVRIVGTEIPYEPMCEDAANEDPGVPCDGTMDGVPNCGSRSLIGHLDDFVNKLGGEVVVCPLCWFSRYEMGVDEPIYGNIAGAVGIHDLFLYADKVMEF